MLALLAATTVSLGCVSQTKDSQGHVVNKSKTGASQASETQQQPDPEVHADADAPERLQKLVGLILAFKAKHGFMPETLENLEETGLLASGELPDLMSFAYQPGGLGVMPDGRIITIVDNQIPMQGFVWCVLSEPSTKKQPEVFTISLQPIRTLEQAAQQS